MRSRHAMKILIACEFSGTVRDAFIARGHEAVSCDILPTTSPGPHIQDDVRKHLGKGWDLIVAHPPCTFLANSGVRWLYGGKGADRDEDRWRSMEDGAAFFLEMLNASSPRIAVENPIMHEHAKRIIGIEQTQTIHPWQFGHGETKATCLWLKGLPMLAPTNIVEGRAPRVHYASPSPDRWKERSATLPGIAAAMAVQWGGE
jgi:hypothetical protein